MKKIMIAAAAVLIVIIVSCVLLFPGSGSGKTVNDYETIRTVSREMEKISTSSVVNSLNRNTSWNIYELGLMYQKDESFFKKLREDLGEDFPWKLSNGDSLFVGVYPLEKKYRIYAGAADMDHMIYPTWNYQALPAPSAGLK